MSVDQKVKIRKSSTEVFSSEKTIERDDTEFQSAITTFSRSLTPKFLKTVGRSMKIPASPSNLRPIFQKLDKKCLPSNFAKPREQSEIIDFRSQLKASQMFAVKKKESASPLSKYFINDGDLAQKDASENFKHPLKTLALPGSLKRIMVKAEDSTPIGSREDTRLTTTGPSSSFVGVNFKIPGKVAEPQKFGESPQSKIQTSFSEDRSKTLVMGDSPTGSRCRSILKQSKIRMPTPDARFDIGLNVSRPLSPSKKVRFSRIKFCVTYQRQVS